MLDAQKLVLCVVAIAFGFLGLPFVYMQIVGALMDDSGLNSPMSLASVVATKFDGEQSELRNERFGFSFRFPRDWVAGPRYAANVSESVGRSDDAFCYVSIARNRFDSNSNGVPKRLRENMSRLAPTHLQGEIQGAKITVENFGRSQLGGQDAREFVLKASSPILGEIALRGHVTQRNYGAIFVVCRAPMHIFPDAGLQSEFEAVLRSFRFDGRAH